MHEAGLPNFEISVWHAFFAPKGTPKAVVDKLVRALQEASGTPRSSSGSRISAPKGCPRAARRPRRCGPT